MLSKLNKRGFAALEVVLIIVIVGLIGGTGYYVWHSKQQTDKSLTVHASRPALISFDKCMKTPKEKGELRAVLNTHNPNQLVCTDRTTRKDVVGPAEAPLALRLGEDFKTVNMGNAPLSLVASIVKDDAYSGCAKDAGKPDYHIEGISGGEYANVGIGCGVAGGRFLFVQEGSTWKDVAVTQGGNLDCSFYKKYDWPVTKNANWVFCMDNGVVRLATIQACIKEDRVLESCLAPKWQ